MTTPVQPDQLRVTIEMGDDYQPTDRLRAALDELGAALAAADGTEVEGFLLGNPHLRSFRTLSYDSLTAGQWTTPQLHDEQVEPPAPCWVFKF
ncbi:MAG TPA: hypothetical protein VK866_08260 [Acidimicrobiales bacterium]|nr:hypothetical protein [Acidimicrobiales bacterium]